MMRFPKKKIIISLIISIFSLITLTGNHASALEEFYVEPLEQAIFVSSGETYIGTFLITNPESNTSSLEYELTATARTPLNGQESSVDFSSYITFEEPSGTVIPYSSKEILFTITIPADALPGGQYISITASPKNQESFKAKDSLGVHEIYLEIAGETESESEIISSSVPSFFISGQISGKTIIENNGKNHNKAFTTLEVTPLFSDTPVYTNSNSPDKKIILPGKKVESETKWEDAPAFGIYNVLYTVRIGDKISELKKLVVLCPIWLTVLILVIISALIVYVVYRKKRKNGPTARTRRIVRRKTVQSQKRHMGQFSKRDDSKNPAINIAKKRESIKSNTLHPEKTISSQDSLHQQSMSKPNSMTRQTMININKIPVESPNSTNSKPPFNKTIQ